jgi:hypothetical protein
MKSGEVFTKNLQDKQQTISGVRYYDIGKNGVSVAAAFAGYPEDAQVGFFPASTSEVGNRSAIVGMDAATATRTADGTGLKFRLKTGHVSVKKRF